MRANYDLAGALRDAAAAGQGASPPVAAMARVPGRDDAWTFRVQGTGFSGEFQIEVGAVPEVGAPVPLRRTAPAPSDMPTTGGA